MANYNGIVAYEIGGEITDEPDIDVGLNSAGDPNPSPFSVLSLNINLLPNGSLVDQNGNRLA